MVKSIAFQGERGAYSEIAAHKFFGPKILFDTCQEFRGIFQKVEKGKAQFGVVPIENSLAGSVHQNYDLLVTSKVWICGEVKLRICHNLISLPGTKISSIKKIFSHPQALSQCDGFIRTLKGVEAVPYFDTAGSAKFVKHSGDPSFASIASSQAARDYKLKILQSNIEDNEHNYTRFFVVCRKSANPPSKAKAKTSIAFALQNIPGGLQKALSVFAFRDIDLQKIESRPIVGSPWQYMFYLDFTGNLREERCSRAICHLSEITKFIKVLGCYPEAKI